MRVKNQKDFLAGILFGALALFFLGIGVQYKIGSAANMGPGYFPTALGILMLILSAIVTLMSLSSKAKKDLVGKFNWSGTLWVLVPVALFGIVLKPLGLVLSLLGLVVASSYASAQFHWKSAVINGIVLVIICLGVFVYGLNLQFQLWPSFLVKY